MRTMLSFILVVILGGCIQIEPEDINEQPVAHFLVKRYIYEAGEKIAFQNRSINAENYNWNFGDGETSEHENPVKSYQLPESKHYDDFVVTLTAENSEGVTDAFSETLYIGKRQLSSIIIERITFTDSTGNKLEEDDLLDLYLYFGLQSNPESHAIGNSRSTTTRDNISHDAFPLVFNFPEQSAYILRDTTMFLEIYEDDGTIETNYKIASFEFNPTKQGKKSDDGRKGAFYLENECCKTAIEFSVKTGK